MFELIPNNVNLSQNKNLLRMLEQWQPNFLQWWMEMGPAGFLADQVYLRRAVSVERDGWARFDYVKMQDYRWGIFLTPSTKRKIHFGDHIGKPVWQDVPDEFRTDLRRIIVTQGDTELASIEQLRLLGQTAPSLYDLRNIFQHNVEEGRHLWAMVYLLFQFFGANGRDDAEELLTRRSGNAKTPRILETFNKPIHDWLAFFTFMMFADRDGKYQLSALSESAFEPLARSAKFMITEEALHIYIGDSGLNRVVKRTGELMKQDKNMDVRKFGCIPLDIIQKYINEWYSASLDLFGRENSKNAEQYFAASLKGRYHESQPNRYADHLALNETCEIEVIDQAGNLIGEHIPMRRAMNLLLRNAYVDDCERALSHCNRTLAKLGLSDCLKLPSQRFNRKIGNYAEQHFDPQGKWLTGEEWRALQDHWLPTEADYAYVRSLMQPVYQPGKIANWIAPPPRGIDNKPLDFEYVQLNN